MSASSKGYTALVTGGTGYVGSRLINLLVTMECKVHLVVRPGCDLSLLAEVIDVVTLHQHDGSTEDMVRIVAESKPKVVFHLASLFLAQHQPHDVEKLVCSNILFGAQLLEAMQLNGVEMLVNTGTSWQHFENRNYSPVCLYAATKQAFEQLVQYYIEAASLQAISLLLFDTYGPDDPRKKLFTLLRQVELDGITFAMSPGEQQIDLVYIDDVVDAFVLAAERLMADKISQHEHYAVSSHKPMPLKELVELYCKVTDKKISIEWGGRPYRFREVMITWNEGETLPGWQPRISLEEGILRMEKITEGGSL